MLIDLESFNLSDAPTAEDDEYEFKSSRAPLPELAKKLAAAVSGFGNAGGGVFIAGVDPGGNADGGIPQKVGSQDLRDWADVAIHKVEPTPPYKIKLITDVQGRGSLSPDSCVLVVAIDESLAGPHQAPDQKYYIRAGAHTVPARHFIVEAIWAKRYFSEPRLTHSFRIKPSDRDVMQLGIVALTTTPAIEVRIDLSPVPKSLNTEHRGFPLVAPVVDKENPYFFDLAFWWEQGEATFGTNIQLKVTFKDLAGNPYEYAAPIALERVIGPIRFGGDQLAKIAKVLESIDKSLKK